MSFIRKHTNLFACFALIFLSFIITLPFVTHAYHIDEPLFLRIAQQIKEHPLNPFGFIYMWNLKYEPIHEIAAFSPLFSYYLALVSLKYSFPPESLIHISLIPFSIISLLSFYFLSASLGFSKKISFASALLLGCSPAFFVSANMAMPDVASLSFALLSVTLGVAGWKKSSILLLIFSGIFLGVAGLLRYNALVLIFLLPFLGITLTSQFKKILLPSAITLGIFIAWNYVSRMITGENHAGEVISIFANMEGWQSRFWSLNIHLTLCTFIPLLYLFLKKKYRWTALLAAVFVALDFGFFYGNRIKQFGIFPDFIFFALGIFCLGIALGEGIKKSRALFVKYLQMSDQKRSIFGKVLKNYFSFRDDADLRFVFFLLWVFGVLAIPVIYVQFASKYLLIAQPPLIFLVLYLFKETNSCIERVSLVFAPILLAISLLIANADFEYANQYREQANAIFEKEIIPILRTEKSFSIPSIWFTGHWGWQYYWEKNGGLPISTQPQLDGEPQEGDFLVTPKFASATDLNPYLLKKSQKLLTLVLSTSLPIRTMNPLARVGLYSNHWGPLPFNFSETPSEEINFYRMKRETDPNF